MNLSIVGIAPVLLLFISGAVAMDTACSLPSDPGMCQGFVPRWYFNTKKGACTEFVYGGCRGNSNNFKTKEECKKACEPTLCQVLQLLIASVPGDMFTPTCKKDGSFEDMQCWKEKGYCLCVDGNGTEIAGTRLYQGDKPNCKDVKTCANFPCSIPYSKCRVVSGKPQCKCKLGCPFIHMPVCGTDGKTYANDCIMEAEACTSKSMISVAKHGDCEGPCVKAMKGALGPVILVGGKPVPLHPNPYIPTCDQDGFFTSKQCNKTSGECWCSDKYGLELLNTRKQNGDVTCDDKCKTFNCGSRPYSQCHMVSGKPQCQCKPHCNRMLDPVCGSDGKTYDNLCLLEAYACKNKAMIAVAFSGECGDDPCMNIKCSRPYANCHVISGQPQCKCQQMITLEHEPVCGNDGKTYGNMGAMTSHSCLTNTTITVAQKGECVESQCKNFDCSSRPYSQCRVVSGKPKCQCQHACPRHYFPVCGSDGKTYGNLCTLKSSACASNKMITVTKFGQCDVDPCKDVHCYRPYAKCHVVGDKPQCQCQLACTMEYAPVCANDGKTYATLCMMKSYACGYNKTITVTKNGKCSENKCNNYDCSSHPYMQCRLVSGKPQCQCQVHCNRMLDPVCGSDGKTYDNTCLLEAHACQSKVMVTVAKSGECAEATKEIGKLPVDGNTQKLHSKKSTSSSSISSGGVAAAVVLSLCAVLFALAVAGFFVMRKRRAILGYGRFQNNTKVST